MSKKFQLRKEEWKKTGRKKRRENSADVTESVLYEGSSSQKITTNKYLLLNVMHFIWLTVCATCSLGPWLCLIKCVFTSGFGEKLQPSERKKHEDDSQVKMSALSSCLLLSGASAERYEMNPLIWVNLMWSWLGHCYSYCSVSVSVSACACVCEWDEIRWEMET